MVKVQDLSLSIGGRVILESVSFEAGPGQWLAVLGENGSGKTTLLDLLMGFKEATSGSIRIFGQDPWRDPFRDRKKIAYLSEKVDLPGDVSIEDFLEFNSRFYPSHDPALEEELVRILGVSRVARVGNLSAGELRRAQIVAALSVRPELILIDEITAVLDIVGRRKLMKVLKARVKEGASVVFATNILEGLHGHVDDVILISKGRSKSDPELRALLESGEEAAFADEVARVLEIGC
jgi:ABC-2 type transport system ATP-binding protein